jgi:hypothetical protein
MRTYAQHDTTKPAVYKRFRSSSTNDGHPQLEFSGFGVRVPGGAQKPRSRECPGLLHARRTSSIRRFQPHVSLSDRTCWLHPIVTVRHITSVQDTSDLAELRTRRALNR